MVHDVAETVVAEIALPSIETVMLGARRHDCPFARITTLVDAGNERFVEADEFWYRPSEDPPDALESAITCPALAGDTTMDSASRVVFAATACGGTGNVIATAVKRLTVVMRRYRTAVPPWGEVKNLHITALFIPRGNNFLSRRVSLHIYLLSL